MFPISIPSRLRPLQSASRRERHDTMPPTFFSKNVDLRLIDLVKENPVLYNPRHPKYTDSDTREVTWQKIGDSLSRPAAVFAGIQCQVDFGDFQEDKHKPGFIEDLKKFLPEQYTSAWGIEKKVLKEFRKHQGLSALDAKYLYTTTARELPTYGVTFFLVKEKQKDKKKLVHRLLGINVKSVLRLDELTKEILQEWPLTHVKTYHATRDDIFTLNFGDYSDKEYSVKTLDACRIRDILEGYIDLIRKRMLEQSRGYYTGEYSTQEEDNISTSKCNIVEYNSHNAKKLVVDSMVGPSAMLTHETGGASCQGTLIMTAQQVVISNKGNHHQAGVKGAVGMRGDMSIPFTRRLNRLNSNSVKIVNQLTEPSESRMDHSRKLVDEMNADLPFVREGIQETIEKQTDETEKKQLQDQMNELDQQMAVLTQCSAPANTDIGEVRDTAVKIADLTTQMYFSLNPKVRKRSKIISRSRPSFVEDENTQKTLRKASFIAAAATALHTLDTSSGLLAESYSGPALEPQSVAALESRCVDELGKLNAALAHYILAHSDPANVDYEAAVNSMHTIHELVPEICKNAQAIASTKDPMEKKQILLDAKTLCDAIKTICSSTGTEDQEKLQEATKDYTDASGRLVFTFGKGKNSEKENELLDLGDAVAAQTSLLLQSAQRLTETAPEEPTAAAVDAAGVRTANKAKDLITQVQLCAPTIQEPHCQSAITAAAERLSSSVQQLTGTCRPLVESPEGHQLGDDMRHQAMELAKALDRLKDAYSGLGDDEGEVFDNPNANLERQRLQFINSVSGNKERWQQLDDQLNEAAPAQVGGNSAEEAARRLGTRLGQLNAAIAALLAATADRDRPDYASAELAISTINELMPQVVEDTKVASANKDEAARASMMEHIRALCDASKGICASSDGTTGGRDDAIAKFTNASGKLVFGVSQRGNPEKENQIVELARSACQKTSQMVAGAEQLSEAVGGERAGELDAKTVKCSDAAQALLTTAQVTAPSISEPRCQSALLSSIDKLSSSGEDLASTWKPLRDNPMHKRQAQGLDQTLEQLEAKLEALRACVSSNDLQTDEMSPEQQKLQFIKTMSTINEKMNKAQKSLDKPLPPAQNSEKAEAIQKRLSGRLGELNAALAALLAATATRDSPDYTAAEDAVRTISDLLPFVVQDTQSSCANKDAGTRAAMLDLIRELCEASRAVCAGADGTNPQDLSDAVSKFSDASGKLVYVVNPHSNADRENQIMGLTAGACGKASQLLSAVEVLSQDVGGEAGQELDSRGAGVADAAQGLLAFAQVTAPSISSPHCKKVFLSAADKVSSSAQELAASWKPLLQDPQHQKQAAALQAPLHQLEEQLDALRQACHIPDDDVQRVQAGPGEHKLQFGRTMMGAQEQILKAQKALDKAIPPPLSSDKAQAVQHRLCGRLDELNAGVAALLAATAHRDLTDYVAAEQAVRTITDLMPYVVQDTQTSSANKDEGTRAAMLDLIRELCEASRAVCAGVDGTNTQGVTDAVLKYSDASGKLVYVVNPRVNTDREKQIVDQSAGACYSASQLLSGVQQLAEAAGGTTAQELDAKGSTLADAVQTLLATSQVTAPSISSPHCKKALLSAADKVSSSAQELAASWKPLLLEPQHQKQAATLQAPLHQLEEQLDALRQACHIPDGVPQSTELPPELQKLQFVKTMSGAKEQIQKAQKQLDKPIPAPLSSEKAEAVQQRLSGRLGELNAAIAALLAATGDREKTDYKAAEEAMKTISQLIPHVVQDTQLSSANKDADTRAAMLDRIRELCEASRAVCARADGTNPQALEDAAATFSDASAKLVYVVNPRDNSDRVKQIMSLSAGASKKTGVLLATVQKLPTGVEGQSGRELQAKSYHVEDAAQALLTTAKVTAPTISEPHSKKAMIDSAEKLSTTAQELVGAWKPLLQGYSWSTLKQPLQQLETQIEELKKACDIPEASYPNYHINSNKEIPREQQKLQFLRSISEAKEHIQETEKALDQPIPPPLNRDAVQAVNQRLSGRLGELNAAIAALLNATSDRENPDYKSAEEAIKTITAIMPHVLQDTQLSCANKEGKRAAMLDLIRELCEASRAVCAGADGANTQDLNDAVSKFTDASGKLVYVVSPRVNEKREQQIVGLSANACNNTSQLLFGVQQLSEAVGGTAGQELDVKGAILADAAQTLLATSQITAPSISELPCKNALLASADKVSSSAQELAASWKPLLQDPKHQKQAAALQAPLHQLEEQLDALRKACHIPDGDGKASKQAIEQQKLHFNTSMSAAKKQIQEAQKALDKPIPPPLNSDKAEEVRLRLSGRLGELNAAIASLISAPADRKKPYYQTAEKAIKTIVDLLPHVIQDSQSASANKDPASRAAMLQLLQQLGGACLAVCAGADGSHPQALSEAVGKFSDASSKLEHVLSPHDNSDEEKIVQLAAHACSQATQLVSGVEQLTGVEQLSGVEGGRGARDLEERCSALSDAAQALLASAQVTAPTMGDPHCKAALVSSADLVSAYGQELADAWGVLKAPRHRQQVTALNQGLHQLQAQLEALRKACILYTGPPPMPRRASRAPPPPAPQRSSSGPHSGKPLQDATRDFLHRIRSEEQGYKSVAEVDSASQSYVSPPTVMTDDEKRMHQLFLHAVEDAEKNIKKTEEGLKLVSKSPSTSSAISAGECISKQAQLQRNIALAAVEVASLVSANYGQTIDYDSASKSTKALPQLMSTIVEDGKQLSSTVSDKARQAFLEDMLQMCQSTRSLCDAARSDRQKLNDVAVQFADKSAKLLYTVSNDVDPTLEKEIISRAKAIGDGVVAMCAPAGARLLCAAGAGARAQDGAGKLIYTAKLVAPSIYETPCQEALHQSADNLSTELKTFADSWKPFSSDPQHAKTVRELVKEADNLQRILEGLKSDVKGGSIGKRREIEKLVVEDTPIRQLTLKIMEDAKKLSELSELSPALKREYSEYSKRLNEALRALDLANARCKRNLHDTNKRRELENAIQNLQIILLQSRPTRTNQERSNIVDLRDFIDEVSSEAGKLGEATSALKVPSAADKKTLQSIIANVENISKTAYALTHTDDAAGFQTGFTNILDVDQFGEECEKIVRDITAQLQSIDDTKARNALYSKMLPLTESCNMLRFATKSGISSMKSVSLEVALDDLDDIEARVITSIVQNKPPATGVTLRLNPHPKAVDSFCVGVLTRGVCAGGGATPRAAVTAYVASAAAAAASDNNDPHKKNQLLKHLFKLVHLLKTQTITTSKRVATWQSIDDPELTTITEQILKEIRNPESNFLSEGVKAKTILNESDLTKLLVPSPAKVIGDTKHQDDKLTQLSSKLSSMCGSLALNIASPESLAKSAHDASNAAVELSAVARGCKNNKDLVQSEQIEKAVQEMSFNTYSVLKSAELACLDAGNTSAKRRLIDTCRTLNDSINKLVMTASTSSQLKKECGALYRELQLQQGAAPAPPAPTSALPYEQCCEALNHHQEIVYKLKSDQPMTRQEFARSLGEVNEAVCRTTEISSQCAYLISVSEKDSDIAKKGPVDVPQIQKSIESLQDSCIAIIGSSNIQNAKEETEDLNKRIADFSRALDEAQLKVRESAVKATLCTAKASVTSRAATLCDSLKHASDMEGVTSNAVSLLEEIGRTHAQIERCPLVPRPGDMSADTRARCDDLATNSKSLLSHTMALVKDVTASDDESEVMTWVTFSTSKNKLLDAYDALLKSIRVNGQKAGILEGQPEDETVDKVEHKTHLEIQENLASKWLSKPMCKSEVKTSGQEAVRRVIDIATKMSEDLKGSEREEIRSVITETEELLAQCSLKYDHEKFSVLMERVKELKKAIQRGVVTRVVEDFIEIDDPMQDLDIMVDTEEDEQKRKFLLERKIAELLAQLGRVTRTARFVADARGTQKYSNDLLQCSQQTELLAPMLVQAAQERISSPNDQAVIDKYKALLAQYAQSISKVRELCDRAVDPMEFVQTAGDTMQRMREESNAQNDVLKGHRTSEAIIKLANRSIEVSMGSVAVASDPELRSALHAARMRLLAATPRPGTRPSRLPDWRESTAEVLRTTGEVESALGGENIFKTKPTAQGTNQQIYSVARDLHECVREWSSRDNEIVGVARRVAVLMARLSSYMESDKKQELISTSKAIVSESHEVAALARKLAHECTDIRIKTNLLQTCERIPTISAQLKMLTTVKGSSLGHQGSKEDTEAMDMLVGNAQSLMLSIQEVVKAAASASVKIMSQRGPKLRWVRKNYY